jgi:hypothetical protein
MDNALNIKETLRLHLLWYRGEVGGVRANLSGANLSGANLNGANLSRANLSGANLNGANLYGLDLSSYSIVPEVGSFQGFKKLQNGYIAHLEIPASAKRVGGLAGRKCRAEFATVLSITDLEGSPKPCGLSLYTSSFLYEVGKTVAPDKWDGDVRVECASGIHFFLSRKEAENYSY